jgi:transmembrane sensor
VAVLFLSYYKIPHMTPQAFRDLLDQYRAGALSDEQREMLVGLLHSPSRRTELEALFTDDAATSEADPETLRLVYQQIRMNMAPIAPVRHISLRRGLMVAASVVVLASLAGWWLLVNRRAGEKTAIANVYKNEVAPGGNHAVLTLANGSRIMLDTSRNGSLASQGGTQVVKMDSGSVAYRLGASGEGAVGYNTVATPIGGQYEIILPDGTKVWLNAVSSLKFPTAFKGGDRTVELTGEGYFEVAKNTDMPFFVRAGGVEVEVLGTNFDVNAYSDEASVRTSLLNGAVRLSKGGSAILLKPGEQADGIALVKGADVDNAVAWKNGYFSFENANLQTVMRQLSRWYGIEVTYSVNPMAGSFGGDMGRDLNLTQVLDGLSKSGVHFKLEGKALTVLP